MTDKSTLNQWFQTGKKPTQEQFWAWQDSYWHKSDTIPADKIENLATVLAGKAEASALAKYAKRDTFNLTDDDVDKWKTRLGVGTLPPNLATYDPAKVNYVMMKDGSEQPAGDLGKNVGNSAVTSVANAGLTLRANWTLNAANYGLYFTGLADKSNDATFNKIPVMDASGKMAVSNGTNTLLNSAELLTDAQIDTLRASLRKSNETYSLGMAVIEGIAPAVVDYNANYNTYCSLVGLNLFVDPGSAQVQLINKASNAVHNITEFETIQTNPSILTFKVAPQQIPVGQYNVKVLHNGAWSLVNNSATLYVASGISNITTPTMTWKTFDKDGNPASAFPSDESADGITTTPNSSEILLKKSANNFISITQQPIATVAEMQAGIMVTLDVYLFQQNGQQDMRNIIGLVNNNNNNNNVAAGVEVYMYAYGKSLTHTPTNVSKNITVADGNLLSDKLVIIIQGGFCSMFLQSQGKGASQLIDMSQDLFLKFIQKGTPNSPYGYYSRGKITINSRKLLS